jgi:ribose-phosphate pyrophosphokinase
LFADYFAKKFGAKAKNVIVASPDTGSVNRARAFAKKMDLGLAVIDKRRKKANMSEVVNIIGSVEGMRVIMFDDMVDTGGSLCNAANALIERGGATEVYACASHGVLSGKSIELIEESHIKEMLFTDTIPYHSDIKSSKIKYLSATMLFAEAIERTFQEVSIATLFR